MRCFLGFLSQRKFLIEIKILLPYFRCYIIKTVTIKPEAATRYRHSSDNSLTDASS
jgi:hypothetical protein